MSATTVIRTARHIVAAAALALTIAPAAQAATEKPVVDRSLAHARIINGTVAADNSWQFIVSLRFASNNAHFCGGSVIAPNLILTAAHCVTAKGTTQKYGAGAIYAAAKQVRLDQGTGERLNVANIVIHPSYDPRTFTGDAALLFLSNRTTAPAIALADYAFQNSALAVNATEWTAGWGSLTANVPDAGGYNATYPNQLMQTALNLYTPAACNAFYGGANFTAWNLCVGRTDSSFCNGDSGGPHVVQATDGSWRLIGITSFTLLTADSAGYQWACVKNFAAVQSVAVIRDWVYAVAAGSGAGAAVAGQTGSQLSDSVAPKVTLKAHKAKAHRAFRVTYTVVDNSRVSAETLVIKKGGRTIAIAKTAFGAADGKAYTIRVKGLRKGTYQLQLTSRDKTGNISHRTVARLRVK